MTTGRGTITEHVASRTNTGVSHRPQHRPVLEAGQGRFLAIARGSATECGAILDVLRMRGLATSTDCLSARGLLCPDRPDADQAGHASRELTA
jgi:hypothetical protein